MTRYLYGFEPGWAAWCTGDREALRHLLAALPMLEFLLALGAPRSLASFDVIEYTPLHASVAAGRADMVMHLLHAGADPNAHDGPRIGNTPIREAVYHGQPEIVALPLRAGADRTIPGWVGTSAVDEAHHEMRGGLDGPAALAIRRLLARFPSRLRTP